MLGISSPTRILIFVEQVADKLRGKSHTSLRSKNIAEMSQKWEIYLDMLR